MHKSYNITTSELALSTATDYYPFGMPMPNRQIVGGEQYRYAFQGQEKDPETGKEAFQLRLWDGRIGRWLTPDPAKEFASPYLGMGNNPIRFIDIKGDSLNLSHVYRKLDGKYVNPDGIEAFETFAKTKRGYRHLSRYAKKGQKIGKLPAFKKDGVYHKKKIDLEFQSKLSPETIKRYRIAGGVTSPTKKDGRFNILIEYTGNDSFEHLVNFTHELLIHATRNTFDALDDGEFNNSIIPDFIKINKKVSWQHEHEIWLQSIGVETHWSKHGYIILLYGNKQLNNNKLSNNEIWKCINNLGR